jgi:hypothetical protein
MAKVVGVTGVEGKAGLGVSRDIQTYIQYKMVQVLSYRWRSARYLFR